MTDDIELEEQQHADCPVCKQDVLILTGAGFHWSCGTCGYHQKVQPEEP